jgi:hypothetical protein
MIPFVKAMNIHTVEFVFICRRVNFDGFSVPQPDAARLRNVLEDQAAVAEASAKESFSGESRGGSTAVAEVHQKEVRMVIPAKKKGSIRFRKVCYQIDKKQTL